MQGFEPVTLSWKGQDYTVPAKKQLELIARIEDALAGDTGEQAISVLFRPGGPPHSRLARALGAALRYAGATVGDDEIYLTIHEDIANKSREQVAATMQMMTIAILAVISPPVSRALDTASTPPKKD